MYKPESEDNDVNYITRGNSSPQGKPKIYYAAHPKDFEKYFDEITSQILKCHNCTIFYDSGNGEYSDEESFISVMECMQLIVVPITGSFIYSPCFARDKVFNYAVEHHIPVLPILEEYGIAAAFNEVCGNLQFLDPHSTDITEISYEEKLNSFLKAVLIGDEMAEIIRSSFDAYVFLSYRKKDRCHAQKLMKLIHSNDFCRDIAIWYDEFLVPGENFNSAIKTAFEKSELFALAVTPNLINEQNYVMTTEYPMAIESGINILPVEMSATNRSELEKLYPDIPECENPIDTYHFSKRLFELLPHISKSENANDPQHNFYIGLAYLGGIDVEKNTELAVKLISGAADAGLPEAVKKLSDMYRYGDAVERDMLNAAEWQEKYIRCLCEKYQKNKNFQNALEVLNEMQDLYSICNSMYDIDKALDVCMTMQKFVEKTQSEIPRKYIVIRFWLIALQCLAKCYMELSDFEYALEANQTAFNFIEKNINHVHGDDTVLLAKSDYKAIALEISEVYRRKYDYVNQRKYVELSRKYDNDIQGSIIESDINLLAMNLKSEADSLTTSCEFELAMEKYIQAEKMFESLYAEKQDLQYMKSKCQCSFERARVCIYMNDFAESAKISGEYINDLLYIEENGYDYNLGRLITAAYEQLVISRIKLKQYDAMPELLRLYLEYAQKAMDFYNERETRKDFARCCTHISEYSSAVGMLDDAIDKQQIARAVYCRHYNELEKYPGVEKFTTLDLAECDKLLSEYYYAAGNKEKAAEYYEECYTVLSRYDDGKQTYFHDMVRDAFFGAGKSETEMKRNDKAIIHYKRAVNHFFDVYEKSHSLISLRSAVSALAKAADAEIMNGSFEQAAEYYDAAINAANKVENDALLNNYKAYCLWNLGCLISSSQAVVYKETAVAIWQALVKEYPDVGLFRDNLNNALNSL